MRWIKTPSIIKSIFKNYTWDVPNDKNKIYLTFDDGPTPKITSWVLAELKKYNAKATFFCIGDNIKKYPTLFAEVVANGHAIGNHTYNHLNGWQTENEKYILNVALFDTEVLKNDYKIVAPFIFRPPYGKIKPSQAKILRKLGYKIIMWDIISNDVDGSISKEECLTNILKNTKAGSIIVFHDSIKAFENLEYVLPKVLAFLNKEGFVFEKL